MQCPRCKAELATEKYKGIEIDRCTSCRGMWLDYHELDELEDIVFDDDDAKASLMYSHTQTDLPCPHCNEALRRFNYRGWDLELDFCENEHGYWLDEGEEKRILDLMKQRIKDLNRSASAEGQFARFLKGLRSKRR